MQCAEKGVSGSLGLLDFAEEFCSLLALWASETEVLREFNHYRRTVISIAHLNFLG